MRISLPWQSRKSGSQTGERPPRTLEAVLTSPLARAIAATIGFFFLRLGVNAHSGPAAIGAMALGALLFWFCVVGRLPIRRQP